MIRRLLCTLVLAQPLAAQPELTAARGLIHAVPGDLPTAIGYLNVAEDVVDARRRCRERAENESLVADSGIPGSLCARVDHGRRGDGP